METLNFNRNYACNSSHSNDVLSAFKEITQKNGVIQNGMTVKEISEIVSEKIITVVKEQFETTKVQFELQENTQKK